MDTVPMTREGLDKLTREVEELEARRPKVLHQIKEAREKGDLSENAEYHAAREDLFYFSKLFKTRYGASPREFRRRQSRRVS